MFEALGEKVPGYKVRDMIREVDLDENGTVEFGEFLEVRSRECMCPCVRVGFYKCTSY